MTQSSEQPIEMAEVNTVTKCSEQPIEMTEVNTVTQSSEQPIKMAEVNSVTQSSEQSIKMAEHVIIQNPQPNISETEKGRRRCKFFLSLFCCQVLVEIVFF